jgi:small subunit ribosomal protein S3
MPAEDHFISRGLLRVKINDYLTRELRRAGYSGVDLQKTPLGMRVVIYAARPGMVIGRRGATVRELTETLEKEFGLEAPQIEVTELEVPELNGAVMAERLAQRLERGDHFRRAAYGIIRRIVGAGSKGVEISIRGKLTSRRARFQKFRSGFVTKTGEPVRTNVSHGTAFAILKPGILGIQVWIMKPEQVTPDRPTIQKKELAPPAAPTPAAGELEIVEEEGPISEQEVPTLEDVREEVAPVTPEEKPASSEPQGKAPAGKLPVEEAPPAKVVEAPEKVKAKAKVKGKPKAEPKKPKAESSKAKAKPKAKSDKASTAKKAKPKAAKSGKDKAKATRKGSGG